MSDNEKNLSEIDAAVDQLTEFSNYFSSTELSNELIEWIHDDLGVNKSLARLVVKKLAPWVLRRAQESGKEIGVAWMSKLHTKLSSQFKPYRLLTIDIASLLLAKVKNCEAEQKRILERKKQVEDVLIRAQSATVILSDDEQWNALDDHQKAWVALSASQERTDNKLDDLRPGQDSCKKFRESGLTL